MDQFTGHKLKGKSRKKWDALPPLGEEICNLFLPIKSPYNPPEHSVASSSFRGRHLNHFLKNNPIYGAVINLCLVEYYHHSAVKSLGVEYHHLPSFSYDEVLPERESRDAFKKLVNDILERKPGKKIIVHCTHGCNRTGYMITTFLAEELNMDLFEAVQLFAEKRPPGPYHLQGIQSFLQETYGEKLSAPQFDFMKSIMDSIRGTIFHE